MNKELFQEHFKYERPSSLLKELYRTKDKRKNRQLVNLINSGLKDLKDEIKEMSENEIGIEEPEKMVDIVERIFELNRQNQQEAKRLNILTAQQMLSRLPISLVQLKAENNSEKLKNEIRQLLHSLYRSKKLSNTVYEHLINAI